MAARLPSGFSIPVGTRPIFTSDQMAHKQDIEDPTLLKALEQLKLRLEALESISRPLDIWISLKISFRKHGLNVVVF